MIGRLLPLLLVGGGLAATGKAAPELTTHVVGTVKALLVKAEMAQIASSMERDAVAGLGLPKAGNLPSLQNWLRSNMTAHGGRDPTLDLWDQPYRFEKMNDIMILASQGPDKAPGDCAGPNGADDDLCEAVKLPFKNDIPFRQIE